MKSRYEDHEPPWDAEIHIGEPFSTSRLLEESGFEPTLLSRMIDKTSKVDWGYPTGMIELDAHENITVLPRIQAVQKCQYCGQISTNDSRGGCGACGAPRDEPAPIFVIQRKQQLPQRPGCPPPGLCTPEDWKKRMLQKEFPYQFWCIPNWRQ